MIARIIRWRAGRRLARMARATAEWRLAQAALLEREMRHLLAQARAAQIAGNDAGSLRLYGLGYIAECEACAMRAMAGGDKDAHAAAMEEAREWARRVNRRHVVPVPTKECA
jgi:hypothetical protein